jgi:molybdopterin molybdotransferase
VPDAALDLDDALAAILADTSPVGDAELVDVPSALGRVLAEAIDAPISLPPFAASAMDGYALRSSDLCGPPPYLLNVSGTSYAGRPFDQPTPADSCVRIFTGAPVPDDLDAVVIQENCRRDGDTVWVDVPVPPGNNVRPVGHDVSKGKRILDSGRRLSEFDLGWLCACGIARVPVHEQPTVGIFSTGDELVDVVTGGAAMLKPGQIFDANRPVLTLMLRTLPIRLRDFGIIPDDRADIRAVLEEADASCAMVVTSGGVSVGDADWVKDVVSDIGTLKMWKLNLKPGKPLAYGRLRSAAFFGLPGNPVSTIITAMMLVRPAIERLCGGRPTPLLTVPATLRGSLAHQPGREEFQRGTLRSCGAGLEVSVTGDQSSNRLASFADANCLIRIPKNCADLSDGSAVTVLPFRGVL